MSVLESLQPIYEWFIADHWLWSVLGFTGTIFFSGRFLLQWYVSEKLGKSVIPIQFWYLSFCGGVLNVIYALHIMKWPIILGFLPTPFIAWRNLRLIKRHARELEAKLAAEEGTEILEGPIELESRDNASLELQSASGR